MGDHVSAPNVGSPGETGLGCARSGRRAASALRSPDGFKTKSGASGLVETAVPRPLISVGAGLVPGEDPVHWRHPPMVKLT